MDLFGEAQFRERHDAALGVKKTERIGLAEARECSRHAR